MIELQAKNPLHTLVKRDHPRGLESYEVFIAGQYIGRVSKSNSILSMWFAVPDPDITDFPIDFFEDAVFFSEEGAAKAMAEFVTLFL